MNLFHLIENFGRFVDRTGVRSAPNGSVPQMRIRLVKRSHQTHRKLRFANQNTHRLGERSKRGSDCRGEGVHIVSLALAPRKTRLDYPPDNMRHLIKPNLIKTKFVYQKAFRTVRSVSPLIKVLSAISSYRFVGDLDLKSQAPEDQALSSKDFKSSGKHFKNSRISKVNNRHYGRIRRVVLFESILAQIARRLKRASGFSKDLELRVKNNREPSQAGQSGRNGWNCSDCSPEADQRWPNESE